jgi:DNA-binding MarR family transcriptional regulator
MPSWLLTQAAAHTHRLVQEGFATVGARGYHYRILTTLKEFGPTSQATLGRRSGIHLSDLVAAVNELVDQAAVERAPDPADKRRNVITLTPAGRRRLTLLDKQLTKIQDAVLEPLSATEREQLTKLLAKLLDHHSHQAPSQ